MAGAATGLGLDRIAGLTAAGLGMSLLWEPGKLRLDPRFLVLRVQRSTWALHFEATTFLTLVIGSAGWDPSEATNMCF